MIARGTRSRAGAPHLQLVGHLLQPALQVLAALHQVLHVVDVREVELEQREEVLLVGRQVDVGQQLEHVAEVVAAETRTRH